MANKRYDHASSTLKQRFKENQVRKGKVLLVAMAIASLLALSSVKTFADGNVVWEGWSQAERNRRILDYAWQDLGKNVGLNCKQWVQSKVLPLASQQHVVLPANSSPDYTWADDPHQHAIPMSMPIESAQPGNLVQMHLKSTNQPHTAIVYAINSSAVTFIESNWFQDSSPNTVHVRTIGISDFKASVTGYTVYPIH